MTQVFQQTPPTERSGTAVVGEVRYRETVVGIPHFDVDMVVLDLIAHLDEITKRFAAHAERVVQENPTGTSDDDWRMAFIEDANEILVAISGLNRRVSRLECAAR